SKTHVASMTDGDFYGSEKSVTVDSATSFKIEFESADGSVKTLRENAPLLAGEVIDTATLSVTKLKQFIAKEVEDARQKDVLFSVHLKATMMKVSDPIIFGAIVDVFFAPLFTKYADLFKELGINTKNG